MPGNDADAVIRGLIARQRVRTRLLIALAAGAMLLDAVIITLVAAVASRSLAGALAVPGVIVVAVGITLAVTGDPERRAGFLDGEDAREYLDRVEPVIARVAAGLHVAVPGARIIGDEALNALSAGTDRDGTVAYTSGLLDALDDDELLEAVTAHLVGRLACGDNGLAVFSHGVLAWSLESFDVVMRLIRWLGKMGNKCLGIGLDTTAGPHGDQASDVARILIGVFIIALGLELVAAAAALFVICGAVALVGVVTLKALARQRMRFADAVAAEIAGPEAARAALALLGGQPTEVARGGVTLQDLCFAGPRPRKGHVEYTPRLQLRVAWLEPAAKTRSAGLLAPVTSAVALTAALALLGLVTAKVPYGRPFSPAGGGGSASLASDSGNATDSPTPVIPSTQPGTDLPSTGYTTDSGGTGLGPSPVSPPPTTAGSSQSSVPVVSSLGSSQSSVAVVSSSGSGGSGGSPSSSPPASVSPNPPPAGLPATPSGVTATPDGQYGITVTWVNNAPDATGFNVDNGCPVGSCSPGATLATTTGLVSSATFTVTPGSYQCFRVQALNSSGGSGWSSYGCTQTPGFTIPATQQWADTGVTVSAGIRLKITASGTVYVSTGNAETPDGDQSCVPSSTDPGANPPFVAPDLPCWSLVGRIGNGAPFEVGSSATITTTGGVLFLSVNDSNFTGNSGGWTANIKEGG